MARRPAPPRATATGPRRPHRRMVAISLSLRASLSKNGRALTVWPSASAIMAVVQSSGSVVMANTLAGASWVAHWRMKKTSASLRSGWRSLGLKGCRHA